MSARDRVFDAVFPPPSDVDAPTPTATPLLGSSTEEAPFGSPKLSQTGVEDTGTDHIIWNLSWHRATSFLALPDKPPPTNLDSTSMEEWTRPYNPLVERALRYLRPGMLGGRMHQDVLPRDDLLAWYLETAIVRHYFKHVLPHVLQALKVEEPLVCLNETSRHLHIALFVYLDPVKKHFPGILNNPAAIREVESRCKYLLTAPLPRDRINSNLKGFFELQTRCYLNSDATEIRRFQQSLKVLQNIGLGGLEAKKILGDVMFDVLLQRTKSEVTLDSELTADAEQGLRSWISGPFYNMAKEILQMLPDPKASEDSNLEVSPIDIQHWQELGLDHLGRIRTNQLFDMVIQWDESRTSLEQLRAFVTSAVGRAYVVNNFNLVTAYRLLHPGASTVEILQVYLNVIRVFTTLDPKGVLLDRVSRSIRRYLRDREDTVSVVVAGLLADPENRDEDPSINGDALIELAKEIDLSSANAGHEGDESELDYDDMTWTPDPVDAGSDFKRSKSIDIITSLLSLFESRNVVVTEFQKAFAERLLKINTNFDREVRVLELLKLRIGENNLQACEVMMRDIMDSRRLNSSIHKAIIASATVKHDVPPMSARVLSHLFWPTLNTETFDPPSPIAALQQTYSNCFETIKASRKLTWLPSLGQVVVSLDLQDRTVTELAQTWQAAVIYAFQPNPNSPEDAKTKHPITRSLPWLVSHLKMSESLVLNAITFWTSKLVLTHPLPQSDPPTFTVLEKINIDDAAAASAAAHRGLLPASTTTTATATATAAAASAPTTAAMLSDHDIAQEKMQLYKQYAIGMLTNGGPMGLAQIVTMLKMTVPGGFPFGNEELKEVLEGEVRRGGLGFAGGLYRIAKPG